MTSFYKVFSTNPRYHCFYVHTSPIFVLSMQLFSCCDHVFTHSSVRDSSWPVMWTPSSWETNVHFCLRTVSLVVLIHRLLFPAVCWILAFMLISSSTYDNSEPQYHFWKHKDQYYQYSLHLHSYVNFLLPHCSPLKVSIITPYFRWEHRNLEELHTVNPLKMFEAALKLTHFHSRVCMLSTCTHPHYNVFSGSTIGIEWIMKFLDTVFPLIFQVSSC